ncbi:hypothetical protein [Niveibacterium terrae]|uniref:hypothetical protein n=1 Tax=Niveibacterium terrae TaxID=3373598 RepID=UPI003A90E634
MDDKVLFEKIGAIIEVLSGELNSSEISDGWTPESKEAIKVLFEKLKSNLQSCEALPPMSISRALDHWGVVSGEMLEQAAQISNQLRSRQRI